MKLQNKAIQKINVHPLNSSNINKDCKDLNIRKLTDFISLQNSLSVKDCYEKEIPSPFIHYFQKERSKHFHMKYSTLCFCTKSKYRHFYRKTFIKYWCINTWNKCQKQFKNDLVNRRWPDVKKLLTENILKFYLKR